MTAPNFRPERKAIGAHDPQAQPQVDRETQTFDPPAAETSGVALHQMQHQLRERVVAEPPHRSAAMHQIERVVVFVSRLAGPVLLAAALIGIIILVL